MSDDLTKRGMQDRRHVNVGEEWEVRYWCGRFRCTPDELCDAVKTVGTGVAALAFAGGKKRSWWVIHRSRRAPSL